MSVPISIAVVGLGYWGPNLARNASSSPSVHLAGICDSDAQRLNAIGSRFPAARRHQSLDSLLDDSDVEAIAIATPVATHAAIARKALQAGKHVLVEKPFVTSRSEARELAALASRVQRTLMLDHVFVHHPAVQKLARLYHSGELGDVTYIDSVRINLGLLQNDVDVLWDLAPHDLSIIDHLVGRPPLSVAAVGNSGGQGTPTSVAYLHLDYGDGLLASVHVNWLSPVKIRHFMVGGTRRSALYNDLDLSEPLKIYDRGVDVDHDPEGRRRTMISYRSGDVVSPTIPKVEALQNVINHFAECILSGKEPISSATQGIRVVEILEAASISLARGGAAVELLAV